MPYPTSPHKNINMTDADMSQRISDLEAAQTAAAATDATQNNAIYALQLRCPVCQDDGTYMLVATVSTSGGQTKRYYKWVEVELPSADVEPGENEPGEE